ncbi:MAG: hypothetical protein M1355_02915 [Patescibacteria group bacterium]|nr:hypothetical protein [Patescibacteria group bacterium]
MSTITAIQTLADFEGTQEIFRMANRAFKEAYKGINIPQMSPHHFLVPDEATFKEISNQAVKFSPIILEIWLDTEKKFGFPLIPDIILDAFAFTDVIKGEIYMDRKFVLKGLRSPTITHQLKKEAAYKYFQLCHTVCHEAIHYIGRKKRISNPTTPSKHWHSLIGLFVANTLEKASGLDPKTAEALKDYLTKQVLSAFEHDNLTVITQGAKFWAVDKNNRTALVGGDLLNESIVEHICHPINRLLWEWIMTNNGFPCLIQKGFKALEFDLNNQTEIINGKTITSKEIMDNFKSSFYLDDRGLFKAYLKGSLAENILLRMSHEE